jgi:hypothetical protein
MYYSVAGVFFWLQFYDVALVATIHNSKEPDLASGRGE